MRICGWETNLAAAIEDARHKRYVLGQHDCFRFACDAVHALTGADLWRDWAGTYHTHAQALRRIAEYGGDFDGAFSRLFGMQPSPVAFARQGDIVKFVDDVGAPHLGVCNGADVALLREDGLCFASLLACAHCWRIG